MRDDKQMEPEQWLNLETAVRSTHLAQPIDSPSISGKNLVTNKVTTIFPDTLDKSIDCTMHALPTAVSRLNLPRVMLPV